MSVLTDRFDDKGRDGKRVSVPAAVDIIYQGALVSYNGAGYAAPASNTAGEVFAGVAVDKVDNSGGSAGDLDVVLETEGTFEFNFQGTAAQTDVGLLAYVVDDNTVSVTTKATAAVQVVVGRIVEFISTTKVRVKLSTNMVS